MAKPISVREARHALAGGDVDRRENVLAELDAIIAAEITDVLWWDGDGNVSVTPSEQLPARMRKAIKKVKIRPTAEGNEIEVEMHDKISALRLAAKHEGLLEMGSGDQRPTLIGINVKHAQAVEYEVKDAKDQGSDSKKAEAEEDSS
tara:strand:- start:104 stop:544 length:441 start_codon:yes stop_codon:yes gene_type:complete